MTEINVLLLAGRGNMKIKIIRNIFFFFFNYLQLLQSIEKLVLRNYLFIFSIFVKNQSQSNSFP